MNIISKPKISKNKPLIYIEAKGNIPTISEFEKVLNKSDFNFMPTYLHVSIRDFHNTYRQGMIAQPNTEPTMIQRNNLAKQISYIAVKANRKKPHSTSIFGIYSTAKELENVIQHKKSIDQIAEDGGFETFHTDDTELNNFTDDFNRYLVKILYNKRLK